MSILKKLALSPKNKILKNFVAFNISFLLIFASYDDIAMVASVLNQDQGLGTTSQAIIYVFQFLSSFVWPQILIQLLGFKLTTIVAEVCYLLFYIANTFPSWYTLVPASILIGFGNSVAWTTLGIYFTILSKKYSVVKSLPFENIQTMFFGWFGFIFFFNYILGAAWLGGILQLKDLPLNTTFDYENNCGAKNYPQTKLPEAASKPSVTSIYVLCGVLNGSCLLAILISALFVDDVKDDDETKREKISVELIKSRFVEEYKNFKGLAKNVEIWLLLPVTMYLGYELTIIWFEYNRAFVSCLKNINYIGWCSIVYGATASIFSFIVGNVVKYVGLQTTMVMMLLVAIAHSIFMISWTPHVDQAYVIFLMAATLGFTNSLATAQVRAIFGLFFPKDPCAYSAAMIFETFGLILGSILSIYFQTRIKIYIYMIICVAGILTYNALEVRRKHFSKQNILKFENSVDKFDINHDISNAVLNGDSLPITEFRSRKNYEP